MSVQTCLAELLRATGEGRTQDEASGNGCRQAFAQLLLADPSRVVLQVIRYFQRQNQNENHLRPATIISTCIGTQPLLSNHQFESRQHSNQCSSSRVDNPLTRVQWAPFCRVSLVLEKTKTKTKMKHLINITSHCVIAYLSPRGTRHSLRSSCRSRPWCMCWPSPRRRRGHPSRQR